MNPADRIFNPSRETDRLLAQAECIGPHTFDLCETWFKEEGRSGQRRMYALVNLIRHHEACHVEKAAEVAKRNGLRSSKAIRRIVESMAAEATEQKAERTDITQEHALIRPGEDYAAFWDQYAAQAKTPPAPPFSPEALTPKYRVISPEELREVYACLSSLGKPVAGVGDFWIGAPSKPVATFLGVGDFESSAFSTPLRPDKRA